MKRINLEIVVGLFVIVGLVCMGYLAIRLGKMEIRGGDTYPVTADFDSASGLTRGAAVEIAGVAIGRVDGIAFDTVKMAARVTMRIKNDVRLQDDVIASVRTRGIIGDKFVKLKPGGSDTWIPSGGRIRETESAVDLEEVLGKYIHGKVE